METEGRDGGQLSKIYDQMLTLAEINISNRPIIRSFDNQGGPVSILVIPTLEDLKSILFEAGDLTVDYDYPTKVTTMQDIESIAFLVNSPPGTIGSPSNIPQLVSHMTGRITSLLHAFNKECVRSGGTTKIYDADGLTELSVSDLQRKYFQSSM